MTRLELARKEVRSRMNGCPLPGCFACKANDAAIEELIQAARELGPPHKYDDRSDRQ